MRPLSRVKALAKFALEKKIQVVEVDGIKLQFSPLAFVPRDLVPVANKAKQEMPQAKAGEDDEALYWSA